MGLEYGGRLRQAGHRSSPTAATHVLVAAPIEPNVARPCGGLSPLNRRTALTL